jgi:NodT family efflux transporter outer membrane factor (OMF) lipoprotein
MAAPLAGAMLLAGCAVLRPPERAEIQRQTGTIEQLGLDQPFRAGGVAGDVQVAWLASFGDEQLNALVAEAVANNPDLRVAATRVEQAAAYVRMAQAALRPQIGIFGTGGVNAAGGDVSSALQGVMLGFSWEPDLWGRLRYARNAAQESEASVRADYEFARQSLAANVAKMWFNVTLAGLQLEETRKMAAAAGDLAAFAEQRQKVGIGDEEEIAAARADQGNFEDAALAIELVRSQNLRALELLLGRYPAAELAARPDLPALPGPVPVGLPLQVLERRPDMIAAERRVAAAFDRVGEAKAAQLPRLVLNASVSAISSDVLVLKPDYENPSAGAGAKLMAPLYQGGALRTQVEIRTLEQKEAVAEYARMALRAIGDVEQSLSTGANLAERAARLERVEADNRRALDLATDEHRVGRGDLRAVRRRELELEEARMALLAVRNAQLAERVNLHLALGGSFEPPPAEGTTAETSATEVAPATSGSDPAPARSASDPATPG